MAAVLSITPNLDDAVTQQLNDRSPFYVSQEGFDMPVVAYDEEYAESNETEGGRRVRSRPQNPSGNIPLLLSGGSPAANQTALGLLEQTVEACRVYGGEMTYTPTGGVAVTYDLESISLSGVPQDEMHFGRARPTLAFTCRPYGRLAAVSLISGATSSDPIQSIDIEDLPGSVPALIRATITDTATQARDHAEVALDPDWDGIAALLVDSASLSISGLAGSSTTRTGAYSTNGVIRTTLATSALACCEATGLTHRGRHRVKARIYGSGTGPIYVRVAYRVGSGPWTRNPWKRAQGLSGFYELGLGIVKANAEAGALTVRIEAYSSTSGDTFDVDYLLILPAYLYAKAKGSVDTVATGFTTRDTFSQSAGALVGAYTTNGVGAATNASPIVITSNSHGLSNGDTVWIEGVLGNTAANGVWTVAGQTTNTFQLSGSTGSGTYTSGGTISKQGKSADTGGRWYGSGRIGASAADSFQVEATGHTAQRTTVSDSSLSTGGSYAILGSAATAVRVQGSVKFSSATLSTYRFGLLARFVDQSNWVALVLTSTDSYNLYLYTNVAGTVLPIAKAASPFFGATGTAHALRLEIGSDGAYSGYWQDVLVLSGSSPVLATGGVLASGRSGLIDAYTSGTANTRNYDDFSTTTPTLQHVVDASGAVTLDHDSIARSDGTRPPEFEGSYLTCPPAGREDRTHRLAVKLRRNDIDSAVDDQIADGQSVDVEAIPRVALL